MKSEIFKPVVNLKWITPNADQMIADMARVSAKNSDGKSPQKLIAYLIKHKHWSPFEMANMCVEIYAPRDITRQILRHKMNIQEMSQRYAEVSEELFCGREARMQHPTNRQMSVVCTDNDVVDAFCEAQQNLLNHAKHTYKSMLRQGVAKECARVILPEGLTLSRMFLNGNVRNWIHYLQSRTDEDTVQKEHVQVANAILELFKEHLPLVYAAAFPDAEGWTLHSSTFSPTVEGVVRNAKDIERYVLDKWPGTLTCRVSFTPAFGFCRIATTNSVGGTELWHDYTVISASTV